MAAWLRTGFGQMQAHAVRDLELDRRSSAGCDRAPGTRGGQLDGGRPLPARRARADEATGLRHPARRSVEHGGHGPGRAGASRRRATGWPSTMPTAARWRWPPSTTPSRGRWFPIALNGAVAGHDAAGGTRARPDARPGGGRLRRSAGGGATHARHRLAHRLAADPSELDGTRLRPLYYRLHRHIDERVAWAASTPLAEPG